MKRFFGLSCIPYISQINIMIIVWYKTDINLIVVVIIFQEKLRFFTKKITNTSTNKAYNSKLKKYFHGAYLKVDYVTENSICIIRNDLNLQGLSYFFNNAEKKNGFIFIIRQRKFILTYSHTMYMIYLKFNQFTCRLYTD